MTIELTNTSLQQKLNIISFTKVGFTARLLYFIALACTGVPKQQCNTIAVRWCAGMKAFMKAWTVTSSLTVQTTDI